MRPPPQYSTRFWDPSVAKRLSPGLELAVITPTGVGRTGRRQAADIDAREFARQVLAEMALQSHIRCATVAAQTHDAACALQQRQQIIGYRRMDFDRGIEAAATHAGLQHIPQAQALAQEGLQALLIGQLGASPADRTHDPPEMILRMRVVLLRVERGHPGHTAQDQDAGVGADHLREAMDACWRHPALAVQSSATRPRSRLTCWRSRL